MEYLDKKSLRKVIGGFLRQRKHLYVMMAKREANFLIQVALINRLMDRWQMVSKWDYWRHCMEVQLMRDELMKILPSASGNHRMIRTHMIALMSHCESVQKIPCVEYRSKETAVRGCSAG